MAELEKVIYSLERCSCMVPDACRDCACDNFPARECVAHLAKDALELLKAAYHEAHCLTLGELRKVEPGTVLWEQLREIKIPAFPIDFMGVKIEKVTEGEKEIAKNVLGYEILDNYGKFYVMCTERPTDEQRKAVKWNETD